MCLAVGVGAARLFSESRAGILESNGGCPLRVRVLGQFDVKRFLVFVVTSLFAALFLPLMAGGQNMGGDSGSWSGIVVSSACDADEAFNESPECLKQVPGATLALYDDTNRVMYGLEPQSLVTAQAGRCGDGERDTGGRDDSSEPRGGDGDWTEGGTEGSGLFAAGSVRARADAGEFAGSERDGAAVFPFGGLVTLLQGAAGRAAKRVCAIRKAGSEAGSDQL